MAEYGEWNQKGATLSDVTAKKEYGVDRNFILKGIRAGKNQTELRKIKKEIAELKKRLGELQARKTELEKNMKR
jgi:hypothetical protein